MKTLAETELVGFLEAVYALELDDEAWLKQALDSISRLCGEDHRYLGFFYDASNVAALKIWNLLRAPGAAPELESSWGIFQSLCEPAFVRSTFRSLYLGSARRTAMPYLEPVLKDRERNGWGDFFYLNGLDPSGIGCLITLGCREPEFRPMPNEAAIFRKLAAHLAAAFRCRRWLASGRAARPHEAAEIAAIEAMRKSTKLGEPALVRSRTLNHARWTLVDRFEEGGRRYVVARENEAGARSFCDLTDRERQIVVHASLGMSNKEIGDALGISEATVRVLMARAAKRFGVHSRKALLAHPVMSEARG